ncbi:AmmeMemoRadiSam system radical SAM enzyme [Thiohalospira sp.]|uniref:AmmeMemoRadiSam system radical SAM enzyme n=1 Tax=Thiohalospira sp. TaxID=3080549 RepID=UPI00397F821F
MTDVGLEGEETVPTKYWHTLDDGRVQCDLCPRYCKLHEGQRGLCFVRANQGGEVVLTTYGRSSGFAIDPIEKKPLNHFLPGTPVLSFGTAGCNLACKYCQNWDISKSREIDTLADRADPETVARTAEAYGCRSVAYTYNDPIIFHEYAIDIAAACAERGIKSVSVTSGYVSPEPRAEFYRYMDAANVDLKSFSEDFYRKLTGGHLEPVLDTIRYLRHETDVWLELTTLVIPGHNDSDEEIVAMSRWIVEELGPDVPLHLTAFHPDWKMSDVPPTPPATLRHARALARDAGLQYVYIGNVLDDEGGTTWCPGCGAALIGRHGYTLTAWDLDEHGHCKQCGTAIPGVFDAEPGHWGSRRQPVRLQQAAAM